MIYIKWLFFVVSSIAMDALGLIVVPFAILLGGVDNRLPKWAQWFDNDREPFGDLTRGPAIAAASGAKKVWLRWLWLAVRNPANNYGYQVCGVPRTADTTYTLWGDIETSDQGVGGWKYVEARKDGRLVAFELYIVIPHLPGRCVRIRLGWKIDDNVRLNGAFKVVDGTPATIVHVINPVMSFTGRR
jgi:hypothetical protein